MSQKVTISLDVFDAYHIARFISTMRMVEAFDIAERVDRRDDAPSIVNGAARDCRTLLALRRALDEAVEEYNRAVAHANAE